MAFHNVLVFCALLFLLVIFSDAERNPKEHNIQQRLTREFNDLPLHVARGFGKRSVNMHMVNNLLLELMALESKLRNLNMPRRTEYEEDLLPE